MALTRNVHVHVHATELTCCLAKSAWCFASFGFQSFGQPEIVFLVRRRPDEQLPPLRIYRFYQQLYLAVSQSHSDDQTIAPGMISLSERFFPVVLVLLILHFSHPRGYTRVFCNRQFI
ncbi:unnamed protein product [Echinostoma caproni]|uniref:Uncharacterized protein n=1 Tax=Echinostoma caproni TaxID=27848 RepID=A0A3P8HB07_9TREM|nr:unnamed protein product [Echinostoma caproni]